MKKRWHRYHYKNLTYLALSIIASLLLIRTPLFREMMFHLGTYGFVGALVGGALFSSTFTVSIGAAILMLLAEVMNPLQVGIIAGAGGVIMDMLIFRFIRSKGLVVEIKHFFTFFNGDKVHHLIHSKYFGWTLPVLGALIIASPLPDELGVSLMGISKMKIREFVVVSFIMNVIGMTAIVSVGLVLKP